jgi:hypothetical protein
MFFSCAVALEISPKERCLQLVFHILFLIKNRANLYDFFNFQIKIKLKF